MDVVVNGRHRFNIESLKENLDELMAPLDKPTGLVVVAEATIDVPEFVDLSQQ